MIAMSKKTVMATIITLALLISLVAGLQVGKTQSLVTITIKHDGSVEGTDKIQNVGGNYVFLSTIYGSIEVEKENITIDGAGYSLLGFGSSIGIRINRLSDIKIVNMEVRGFQDGIKIIDEYGHIQGVSYSRNINISSCTIKGNSRGIVTEGTGSFIFNNSISGNEFEGIRFSRSLGNKVSNNIITGSNLGIFASYSHWNEIMESLIIGNGMGIGMDHSVENQIIKNTFKENHVTAIELNICSNYKIYRNNFINNINPREKGLQVSLPGIGTKDNIAAPNEWDNGSEGNYWSDYKTRYPNATESGSSGIGDTPFFINENNIDPYPLWQPFAENTPQPPPTSLSPSPTTQPTSTSSPNPTPSPSLSPTQKPTLEPTQSVQPTIVPIVDGVDPLSYVIGIVAVVIVAVAVSFVIYFKRLGKNQEKNYAS
jgi:parallel beta-helix repeat protein